MWFFSKNKKKKYVSCDLIEHGMDFHVNSINFCCRIPPAQNGYKKIIENFNGELLDWNKFFLIKRNYRNQMKKGNIIKECRNCIYLKEKEWDNDDYISFINFNNWSKCNAHCIYCSIYNDYDSSFKQYNVFPVLKDMAEKGYLRKGGDITIAGGEPCIAPEFNDLLNLFLDYDLKPIRLLTNASIYSEVVEKAIKLGNLNIVISVDSGTQETFLKIKGYDFYDKVWANVQRYAFVQPANDRVITKFILIPSFNDSREEIDAWISKSISVGVKHLAFDVEMNWYEKNKCNIPQSIFELITYVQNKVEENKLDIEFIDRGYILSKRIIN